MTLLARNEEDVVEENLLYHLNRGVDFVVATDNASDDSTREVLADFERQGVLHLIDEPEHSYNQGVWVTRMARLAATDFGADWVLNNDADEFFWPESGSLADVLAEIPERFGVLTVPRTNFLPRPESRGGRLVRRPHGRPRAPLVQHHRREAAGAQGGPPRPPRGDDRERRPPPRRTRPRAAATAGTRWRPSTSRSAATPSGR